MSQLKKRYLVVGILTFIALYFILLGAYDPDKILFTDDIAISFAVGEQLFSDPPLLGPPSHVGGRHLGPAYYWYVGLVQFIGGDPATAISIFPIIKLGAFFLAGFLLFYLCPRDFRFLAVSLYLYLLVTSDLTSLIRTPWHNNFLVVPVFLYLASVVVVLKYGLSALMLNVLAGSLLVQGHFASLPLVAGGTLVLGIFLWRNHRNCEAAQRVNLLCIPLVVLVWLPTVLYELSYPSNILKFITVHFGEEGPQGDIMNSLISFLQYLAVTFQPSIPWLEAIREPGEMLTLVSYAFLIFVFLCFVCRKSREQFWFALVLFFGVVIYLPALVGEKQIHNYYYLSVSIPIVLLMAALISFIIYEIARRVAGSHQQKIMVLLPILLLGFTAFKGVNSSIRGFYPARSYETPLHAKEVARILVADSKGKPFDRLVVKGPKKTRRNAYYYFLGPEFYKRMRYKHFFREIENFREGEEQQLDNAYLFECAYRNKPRPKERAKVLKTWEIGAEVPLDQCSTCESCNLFKLTRRE